MISVEEWKRLPLPPNYVHKPLFNILSTCPQEAEKKLSEFKGNKIIQHDINKKNFFKYTQNDKISKEEDFNEFIKEEMILCGSIHKIAKFFEVYFELIDSLNFFSKEIFLSMIEIFEYYVF